MARIIKSVETARNLSLLMDYQAYLRVEKGLRPLTCEAYDSDLRTFAEFIESRHGVLLTATQEDVAAFLEDLRMHGIDAALGGAQVELPARLLQVAAARPAHPSRSNRKH